ncbi:N-6 DNA methylase [Streptomyces sp. NBC_00237]|uniref:N-6 DNA methylase n=1 Tax=Streptomyces sp. NBC_00237 TaxID=2975687 RepID=UPI002259313B|nr:N-6 DNA methylase [Streptomyces sp. NBC_00237]MCX5204212.1 N-6 DNA methylase [Streptomyces sp. NBC_00237]
MPHQPPAQVTAAEISRIAGVTRATVSNWRRRHDDFPVPAGGTDSSPLYDLQAVQNWLNERGHTSEASPEEALRTALRLYGVGAGVAARLIPLVLAASRLTPEEMAQLASPVDTSDEQLVSRADVAAGRLPDAVPLVEQIRYGAGEAPAVRALLHCVQEAGPQATLGVLAERELEESGATGAYLTPEGLATLMARLLPEGVTTVLDPACGSGALLAAAAGCGASSLYGQDTLAVQGQRSAVRLLLEADLPSPLSSPSSPGAVGAESESAVQIRLGDSLRDDAFPGLTVDAVLCNPPFGDRDWGHDELAYDPRWAYGVPPRMESELAWVQHALSHTRPGGLVIMLLPPGAAFRTSGRRIRADLVRSGALRAVVSLPQGAAHPLHIGLHIWVLQRPEPGGAERKSVLFVNAESGGQGGARDAATTGTSVRSTRGASRGPQPPLNWPGLTKRVLDQWTAFSSDPDAFGDEPGVSRAVPMVDLIGETVDLSPARHVRSTASDIAPEVLAGRVADLRSQLTARMGELAAVTGSSGDWQPSDASSSPDAWRTATVSDLARGGALALLRGALTAPRDTASGKAPTEETDGAVDDRLVLRLLDVAAGNPPSGTAEGVRPGSAPQTVVTAGDVVLCGTAPQGGQTGGVPEAGHSAMSRVADDRDAGALLGPMLHLLRPDPARLDAWFLAGFLGAEDNIAAASTGTSSLVHVNPGRLRVPLMPLEQQRRYGDAFRRVHELRQAAREAGELATGLASTLTTGLTAGALLPPPVAPASAAHSS